MLSAAGSAQGPESVPLVSPGASDPPHVSSVRLPSFYRPDGRRRHLGQCQFCTRASTKDQHETHSEPTPILHRSGDREQRGHRRRGPEEESFLCPPKTSSHTAAVNQWITTGGQSDPLSR